MVVGTCAGKALCGRKRSLLLFGKALSKGWKPVYQHLAYGGYVAVALHSSCEVGVDIEQYGTRVRKSSFRFIRSDEEPAMMEGDDVYALLLHWSAKGGTVQTDGE